MEFKDRFVGGLRRQAAREALVRSAASALAAVALMVLGAVFWGETFETRPYRAWIALAIAPALIWVVMTQMAMTVGWARTLARNEPPLRIRGGRLVYLNSWVLDVPLASIRGVEYRNNGAYSAPRGLSLDVKGRLFRAWIPSDPIDATLDDIRAALGLSA